MCKDKYDFYDDDEELFVEEPEEYSLPFESAMEP